MPATTQSSPLALGQSADAYERKTGTTYREMEIALPRELDAEQRAALVREFVRQEIGDRHAYQWAIHVPTAADGGRAAARPPDVFRSGSATARATRSSNFKRYNAAAPGEGRRTQGLRPERGPDLDQGRAGRRAGKSCAGAGRPCNAHRAGCVEQRIDMRSHAERGTGLEPERKQLPSQWRAKAGWPT
ncbi:hypothetical protein VEE57_45370 (plasmid) [Escherichia coli]|nr:hypothetical protein VEE57_45370 [Escherichia coli]